MKSIYISGNAPLYGEVTIQGSKNAALPIMAAALLIPGISVLKNCPRIADVEYMCRLLQSIGCFVERDKNEVRIDASAVSRSRLPEEYVTMMRSSVMLMGPMLGRTGEVSLHYPGGCVIAPVTATVIRNWRPGRQALGERIFYWSFPVWAPRKTPLWRRWRRRA